ncbi:MAG: hypothetical protein ACI3W5_03390 [Faecousia sp.]
MKSHEISPKAFTAWLATAMLGPVAMVSAVSSWSSVLVSSILCGVLCAFIYRCCDGGMRKHKLYSGLALIWNVYAAAVVANWGSICWPGKGGQVVVPLVLIALAAISAYNGTRGASSVGAALCPLCAIIFAVVLACGVGNLQWHRITLSTAAPGGMLLFVFLLPLAAVAIPRQRGAKIGGALAGIAVFAVLISVAVIGTLSLPVALTREDAFYEFSKSLQIFSAVQRFESIAAVAVTLSVYAMLSLLLSAVGELGESIYAKSGKWIVLGGAAVSAIIVVMGYGISSKYVAILSLLVWAIGNVLNQAFPEKR